MPGHCERHQQAIPSPRNLEAAAEPRAGPRCAPDAAQWPGWSFRLLPVEAFQNGHASSLETRMQSVTWKAGLAGGWLLACTSGGQGATPSSSALGAWASSAAGTSRTASIGVSAASGPVRSSTSGGSSSNVVSSAVGSSMALPGSSSALTTSSSAAASSVASPTPENAWETRRGDQDPRAGLRLRGSPSSGEAPAVRGSEDRVGPQRTAALRRVVAVQGGALAAPDAMDDAVAVLRDRSRKRFYALLPPRRSGRRGTVTEAARACNSSRATSRRC